jgi:hypothetical protein
VTVWVGDWAFRIRVTDNESWIDGGVPVGNETLALCWEVRAGVAAAPFLPPATPAEGDAASRIRSMFA